MPSVAYKVFTRSGEELRSRTRQGSPTRSSIDHIEEPIIRARIIVPNEFVGPCMDLSETKRGTLVNMENPDRKRTMLTYDFPWPK